MSKEKEASKDDVARLIRGRPSRGRVGSRQIRHRLRQDEIERLQIARSRGFLLVTKSSRAALRNSWYLDCQARKCACLYVERAEVGFQVTGSVGTKKVETILEELDDVARFVQEIEAEAGR